MEQANKPYFTINPRLYESYPEDKYYTTHRCFGSPCKGDLLQIEDEDKELEQVLLQQHRCKLDKNECASFAQVNDDEESDEDEDDEQYVSSFAQT